MTYKTIFFVVLVVIFSVHSMAIAKNNPVRASVKEMERASSVLEREKAVAEKEKMLAGQEEKINTLNAELDKKIDRLGKLQDQVEVQLNELKTIKTKRFKDLIKVYSTMSASKVAPLLNSMEDGTVAEILRAMKTDAVAKIMPKLDPEKAVRVSRSMGLLKKQ